MTLNKTFFRRVADEMLDNETARHIAEQEAAIANNPEWAEGYYHLANCYEFSRNRSRRNGNC